jgi:hypothetical protein
MRTAAFLTYLTFLYNPLCNSDYALQVPTVITVSEQVLSSLAEERQKFYYEMYSG